MHKFRIIGIFGIGLISLSVVIACCEVARPSAEDTWHMRTKIFLKFKPHLEFRCNLVLCKRYCLIPSAWSTKNKFFSLHSSSWWEFISSPFTFSLSFCVTSLERWLHHERRSLEVILIWQLFQQYNQPIYVSLGHYSQHIVYSYRVYQEARVWHNLPFD